jgi:hypothetical protein
MITTRPRRPPAAPPMIPPTFEVESVLGSDTPLDSDGAIERRVCETVVWTVDRPEVVVGKLVYR